MCVFVSVFWGVVSGRLQVDITEGIQKQCSILWCKECNRYLSPPKHWVVAELESKELLTYCIKRVRGLQKVRLVDAGFIWTEPHSRRLKVKITIQKEVFNGAILQQPFIVEYVVEPHMCDLCSRAAANSDQWTACVQVTKCSVRLCYGNRAHQALYVALIFVRGRLGKRWNTRERFIS